MRDKCYICYKEGVKGLCSYHKTLYKWDSNIQGFRLKKKNRGSRYTKDSFHKSEIKLTKILEQVYGSKNVITSFHPIWALSLKGVLLEFDIYIKNKNILVEYNSDIHFKYTEFFHKTYTNFVKQKARDKRKAKLANKNNKCLIIITHDEPMFKDYIINKIEKESKKFYGICI